MQWILIPFGWAFIAVSFGFILVPYLKGRGDLLTSWNLFLLGSANFVGVAAIQSGYYTEQYMDYEEWDYLRFVAGAVVFYAVCAWAYYKLKFPRRAAGRRLRKWPTRSNGVLWMLLLICLAMGMLRMVFPMIQGASQVIALAANSAALIAMVYAFVAWYRQPMNPILLVSLVGIGFYSLFYAVFGGTGRRDLLSLAMTFPICLYWLKLRYMSRGATVGAAVLAVVMIGALIAGYTAIRHQMRGEDVSKVTRSVAMIRQLPSAIMSTDDTQSLLGANSVEASIAAIHLYVHHLEPQPFFTLYYILVNPIPRALWPGKPIGLGKTLPNDTGWSRYGRFTWGPGIVGHGYQNGGLHMLAIFGFMVGATIRFFDELLVRQSDNPFLLGIFAAVSGQIVAWSRGDIGVFTLQIISGVMTGLALSWIARAFFGTGTIYPSDEDRLRQMAHSREMARAG